MIFSTAGAYLLIVGFSLAPSLNSNSALINSISSVTLQTTSIVLLLLGFLIKSGSLGVHIWVPGAYSEAEDDMTPFISSVLSKVGVFGIFIIAISYINSMPSIGVFMLLAGLVH